jgi:MFS family permease
MEITQQLSRIERRAVLGLSGIFGLRMLGMFLILPVFALYARELPGGDDHFMVGLALGAYGLTQALLQIIFGMASDRYGRKPVIVLGLLLFVAGSVVAALADTLMGVLIGRVIQGAGAISAAVTALLADLTREEHRTKAMASIGATIGLVFAVSLVAAPVLDRAIGVAGMFWMMGALAFAAIAVVVWVVPNPPASRFHADAEVARASLGRVLRNVDLARLDYGIFALHAAQMALFVAVPVLLTEAGLDKAAHWKVYLPVLLGSFVVMLPAIIAGEKRGKLKPVFVGAVALLMFGQIGFALWSDSLTGLVAALFAYFVAFNLLEASLPSLISKLAPADAKGTAMGVYNTAQALGVAAGGAVGGWLAEHHGFPAVFMFCAVLVGVWLAVAAGMRTPPAVRTRLFRVAERLSSDQAGRLGARLAALAGVVEAAVIAEEGVAMLKVSQTGWDETTAMQLMASMKLMQGEV